MSRMIEKLVTVFCIIDDLVVFSDHKQIENAKHRIHVALQKRTKIFSVKISLQLEIAF